eukprot:jgi/Botrbrau1/17941/Bobra.50_1s0037.1
MSVTWMFAHVHSMTSPSLTLPQGCSTRMQAYVNVYICPVIDHLTAPLPKHASPA